MFTPLPPKDEEEQGHDGINKPQLDYSNNYRSYVACLEKRNIIGLYLHRVNILNKLLNETFLASHR